MLINQNFANGKKTNNNSFCIKDGYIPNLFPKIFDAYECSQSKTIYQPDVYNLAYHIASQTSCSYIIDVGSGDGLKLKRFDKTHKIIAVDIKENEKTIRSNVNLYKFIPFDLEEGLPAFDTIAGDGIIIVADVIEHIVNPDNLLRDLANAAKYFYAVLCSTPERDLVRGYEHFGPPPNRQHVREWNIAEFEALLKKYLFPAFEIDLTINDDLNKKRETILALTGNILKNSMFPALKEMLDEVSQF